MGYFTPEIIINCAHVDKRLQRIIDSADGKTFLYQEKEVYFCGDNISPFLLILFVWVIACQFIDILISKIEFRKWSHYCVTESVILYLLSLFFFRMFIWDDRNILRLISFTVIFLVTDMFIFWYFHKRQELQAEEINQLIRAREK